MSVITIPNSISETVLRKALYWCSPFGAWTLQNNKDSWVINVTDPSPEFEFNLHRHINDFVLREKIDSETGSLRQKIIVAALKGVLKHVEQ